jgi:hypothetical protein
LVCNPYFQLFHMNFDFILSVHFVADSRKHNAYPLVVLGFIG